MAVWVAYRDKGGIIRYRRHLTINSVAAAESEVTRLLDTGVLDAWAERI